MFLISVLHILYLSVFLCGIPDYFFRSIIAAVLGRSPGTRHSAARIMDTMGILSPTLLGDVVILPADEARASVRLGPSSTQAGRLGRGQACS